MLKRLIQKFSARPQAEPLAPEMTAGTRLYAIGDIHGRVDLLRSLHQMIREDLVRKTPERAVVVYLGDYIDRGEASSEVVEELLARPLDGVERVHLMGNHEWAMLGFLENPVGYLDWLEFGGRATLGSYGAPQPDPGDPASIEAAHQALHRNLPKPHLRFLKGLSSSYEEGGYFFAHAGVRPGVPLANQSERDLMMIRDSFTRSCENFGKMVVHGHTISAAPEFRPNRIGIDTGAFATGCLTCLCLEGAGHRLLQTS